MSVTTSIYWLKSNENHRKKWLRTFNNSPLITIYTIWSSISLSVKSFAAILSPEWRRWHRSRVAASEWKTNIMKEIWTFLSTGTLSTVPSVGLISFKEILICSRSFTWACCVTRCFDWSIHTFNSWKHFLLIKWAFRGRKEYCLQRSIWFRNTEQIIICQFITSREVLRRSVLLWGRV